MTWWIYRHGITAAVTEQTGRYLLRVWLRNTFRSPIQFGLDTLVASLVILGAVACAGVWRWFFANYGIGSFMLSEIPPALQAASPFAFSAGIAVAFVQHALNGWRAVRFTREYLKNRRRR